jgi:formylglycine-generating enzyme required for sulfatase activity
MVYVPQASFYVGDGTATNVVQQLSAHNSTSPFQITGEGALTLGGTTPGNLGNRNNSGGINLDDFNFTTTQSLPAAYPKGYNAFYCMKYELTQQGYVDFLNTLTRTQQASRTATNLASGVTSVTNRYIMINSASMTFRNGIRCDATIDGTAPITFYCDFNGNGIGGEAGDGQKIACNFLGWSDVRAYLDWAGLRPMTELEYEKACRGPNTPVANEFAWGTTSLTGHSGLSNSGSTNETSSNAGANCANTTVISLRYPLRVGAFAKASSTRTQAGATYYGIMDMTGNLWERPVTIGNATGRAYTGAHGNGMLNSSGDADVLYWPGTDAIGSGGRGGDFRLNTTWLRVSDRGSACEIFTGRLERIGIRGIRTAQ